MNTSRIKETVEELLRDKLTTLEFYFELKALFTEEREELHETILDKIINSRSFSRNKSVYILGGAPANGKSTFLQSKFCSYPVDALKIDPDEIKKMLPEYNFMVAAKEALAANIVHEESSVIAKKIRKEAMRDGIDIILDGVADDSLQKRKEEYANFKKNGYFVKMDYVSLDTKLSLQLAKLRAEQTGREVPQSFVKEMNAIISRLVPELIENPCFDELSLWDTNEEKNPRLILQHKNGKLKVIDKVLYENFKNKKK